MTDKSAIEALIRQCEVWMQPSHSFTEEGRTRDVIAATVAGTLLNLIAQHRTDDGCTVTETFEYILQTRFDANSPWETWGTPYSRDEYPQILERLSEKAERYAEFDHRVVPRTVVTTIGTSCERRYADRLDAPMPPGTVAALRDRLASDDAPVRKVRSRNPVKDDQA